MYDFLDEALKNWRASSALLSSSETFAELETSQEEEYRDRESPDGPLLHIAWLRTKPLSRSAIKILRFICSYSMA